MEHARQSHPAPEANESTEGSVRSVDAALLCYMRRISLREPDVLKRLRAATARLPEAGWETAPEQGQLLAFLIELIGAERVLEIGTFTGYGTLWMARALPSGGRIVTCDLADDFPSVGRPFWNEAGVADRIEQRLGPAADSLQALAAEGWREKFDMAFIDANKKDYDTYFEYALALVRSGGLIVIDNIFWHGAVLDQQDRRKSTRAIRALNKKLHRDPRVSLTVLPLDDGFTLARKRQPSRLSD